MKRILRFLTLAVGLFSFIGVERVAAYEEMVDAQVERFTSQGVGWTVKPKHPGASEPRAFGDLLVRSDSGEIGSAEPAWEGDDPGEFGPLWAIHNAEGIVIGTCSSPSGEATLTCMNIYLHETLPSSTPQPPSDSPSGHVDIDGTYLKVEVIPFTRNPFTIKPTRLLTSQMRNLRLPSSRLPSSQMPSSQMPGSWMPRSLMPSSHMPLSNIASSKMAPSRMSSSRLTMWP